LQEFCSDIIDLFPESTEEQIKIFLESQKSSTATPPEKESTTTQES